MSVYWLTVEKIMAARPCSNWSCERVERWFAGRKRVRLITLLCDEQVSAVDRWWVLCYAAGFDDHTLRLLAVDTAEMALLSSEQQFPDDCKLQQVIEVTRRFTYGEATEDEMYVAMATAKATAEAVTWDATSNAAWAVIYAASGATSATAWTVKAITAWAAKAAAGWDVNPVTRAIVREQQLVHASQVIRALECGEPWPKVTI